MSKSIAILLLSTHNITALHYAKSAVAQGFSIHRVFFYHDAVYLASSLHTTPQDELNLASEWQQLIQNHTIPATVCIASALKRGILDEAEAKRYQKHAANLRQGYELAGLGTWLEATLQADQHITFY